MKIPDALCHGTSLRAAARIIRMGRIILPRVGNLHISTSSDPDVALHWAQLQSTSDDPRLGGSEGAAFENSLNASGAIFFIKTAPLLERGASIAPFSDPCWGEGACDWENEWAIDRPVPSDCWGLVLYDTTAMASIFASANWRHNTFKAPTVA